MSPYHYAANNPMIFVDVDGLDWFYYKDGDDDDAGWHWQDGSEYEHSYTYKDKDGNEKSGKQKLQGVKAAIVFDGTGGEKLGKGDNLYGEGAKLANVTVYGPGGEDDVETYDGYTMSSDPSKYGVVESNSNDYYEGSNIKKSGSLYSFWRLGKTGVVPAKDGKNASNGRNDVWGAFVHTSNRNGSMWYNKPIYEDRQTDDIPYVGVMHYKVKVGSERCGISQGCPIIAPGSGGQRKDWNRFVKQMGGKGKKMSFAVQILR